MTINQFDLEWRGNWLVELGDKIAITTKDDNTVYAYLVDDTITYDGSYNQKTKWEYTVSDAETPSNPTSLGDVLKHTYARVDKANQEITLLVSDVSELEEYISSINLTIDGINSEVSETKTVVDELGKEVSELTNKVSLGLTSEDVKILIENTVVTDATSVTTNTGFTFNDEGLTISKSDSEMTTLISEDGMIVSRDDLPVLVADNEGVKAENLHATTFLIIGKNSRFEDYGNRTGCFWIGG
jgi:uncharacterized coiled-coil protein SlyX